MNFVRAFNITLNFNYIFYACIKENDHLTVRKVFGKLTDNLWPQIWSTIRPDKSSIPIIINFCPIFILLSF